MWLIKQFGDIKYLQASYDSAEFYYQFALKYSTAKTSLQASTQLALSRLNIKLMKISKAQDYSISASENAYYIFKGDYNSSLIPYLENEAYLLNLLNRNPISENLYLKCLTIDTANQNKKGLTFSQTLNGLGLIKTKTKRLSEADTLFDVSLKILEEHAEKEHPDYAIVLFNKGYLKLAEGKIKESEELFNEALLINIKKLGANHDIVADNYYALGEVKLKNLMLNDALDYFKKAEIIYKSKFKSDHLKMVATTTQILNIKKKTSI